jgi:hypothetical protein
MRLIYQPLLLASVGLCAAASPAGAQILYQAGAGQTPETSGWLTYADSNFSGNYFTASASSTLLDTTAASSVQAGWSNYSFTGVPVNGGFPALNRTDGFALNLTLRFDSATSTSTDRGGLSVILLGSDHKGIELDFTSTTTPGEFEVFAQEDGSGGSTLFTRGESSLLTSPASLTDYSLSIAGDGYTFRSGASILLSGAVRDYSAFPNPPFPIADPYELSNYLFVGDNTTSASSAFAVSAIAVVPEPVTMAFMPAMLLVLRRRRVSSI